MNDREITERISAIARAESLREARALERHLFIDLLTYIAENPMQVHSAHARRVLESLKVTQ